MSSILTDCDRPALRQLTARRLQVIRTSVRSDDGPASGPFAKINDRRTSFQANVEDFTVQHWRNLGARPAGGVEETAEPDACLHENQAGSLVPPAAEVPKYRVSSVAFMTAVRYWPRARQEL
jgi:hypothetical protein